MYGQWPYLSVLGALIACSLGLPLPDEIVMLTGGFLCHRELASPPLMMAVVMVGVLGGDFILFGIGRKFGHHVTEHRFVRRLVKPARLATAERLFDEQGVKIIFAGRFLTGLRPMVFMAAGVLKVPFWKFAAVNGLAACISVPALVLLGKFFGDNLEQIKSDVRTVTRLIALGIIVVALVAIGIYLHRRQKTMMASAAAKERADTEAVTPLPPRDKASSPEPEALAGEPAQSAGSASSVATVSSTTRPAPNA